MEISNVPQGASTVAINSQPANTAVTVEKQPVAESNAANQKDFQVDVKDGLKAKLAEFVAVLQNRDQLIKSLPEDIQKAISELLQQMSGEQELPQGITALLQGQKNIAEQLKNMGNLLEFAAILNKDENSELQGILQKILENFTEQSEKTPEQAAKDLLQLAKQLVSVTTMSQEKLKQAVEQLLQQTLPENMQELTPAEQKIVTQLTKLLGKDMPAQLQQLVQDSDLPDLPGVWATLKAADAWQLKDVQPKTLQAAADLLRQLVQEMPCDKNTSRAQVEQFVKSLPPEVKEQAGVMAKIEQFIKNLSSGGENKATTQHQVEEFVKSLPLKADQQVVVNEKLQQLFKQLPTEAGNKATVNAQLEQFIKTLPAGENAEVAPQVKLEQFIKTLPPEIGKALQQALQQATKQGNIPDSLRSLAETFSNAALLNQKMSGDVQSFVVKIVENFAGKSTPMPADVNDVLSQLAKQFTDTATTIDQLKTLMNQLKSQLFANDPKLLEKAKQVLEQLTQLFEQNIPQALQDGAVKHKLPELPKIWVLLKALGGEQWQNLESQNLQKSAGVVKELAQSMYKSTALAGEKQAEHSILSFSVPLQVAEGIFYPAHIHIYHQEKDSSGNEVTERQFETWLRVSVDTENIGMVDSVFRLYGDNKLDVRVNFPVASAANEFMQELPAIRKNIESNKLTVTDILISKQ